MLSVPAKLGQHTPLRQVLRMGGRAAIRCLIAHLLPLLLRPGRKVGASRHRMLLCAVTISWPITWLGHGQRCARLLNSKRLLRPGGGRLHLPRNRL